MKSIQFKIRKSIQKKGAFERELLEKTHSEGLKMKTRKYDRIPGFLLENMNDGNEPIKHNFTADNNARCSIQENDL